MPSAPKLGTANSSGDAESLINMQVWHVNVRDAAELLSSQVNSLGIVAFRTGALLAADVSLTDCPVNARYYWDPVLSGEQWLAQTLVASLQENAWNHSALLLVPSFMADDVRLTSVSSVGVDIQPLDEVSDWLDPRATTRDMMITLGAQVLADKLIQHSQEITARKRQVG